MTVVSARDASRGFSGLLDRVEHDGAEYTVVRDGKAIARIVPVGVRTVSDFLGQRAGRPALDDDFARDAGSAGELLSEVPVDPRRD